ncbi:MAG: hypothetical protein JOZ14_12440 [Acidobacteria bacterium]|nr:hypothetical protein [Acidobacteriota bacterium]
MALRAVEEMIFKEKNILLPMSLQTLTDGEWAEVWTASAHYGRCIVEPRSGYSAQRAAEPASSSIPKDGLHNGDRPCHGRLSAVLSTLPLDLTFVDADDRVAF